METQSSSGERLQKILANAGIASRRKAEQMIVEGAVTVNGKIITTLGTKADPKKDKIKVHGKLIFTEVEPIYLMLYKPQGVISSLSDPEGRPCLKEYIRGIRDKVVPVGRLDFTSEGLILLMNDGDLVNKLLKAHELVKTYHLKVKGHPSADDLRRLEKGLFTEHGVVRFKSVKVLEKLKNKTWISLEVIEGSKLNLREILNQREFMVDKIIRYGIGHLNVRGMEAGDFNILTKADIERLL